MFNIRFGEHSPRVTLLQILLNSHSCVGADGKRLTVDGLYGRNTRAAVSAGSRLLGVGDLRGGAATPALIKELLADVDLNVITSVDLGDPELQIDIDTFKAEGNDPIVLGGMCNGLQQMVNDVTARARPGRVAALRFDGHGNLGRWLTISVGNVAHLKGRSYQEIENEVMSYISSSNFSTVSSVISPLSRIFAPFAFAEHLGCTLGARRETRAMLKKLADLWGVAIRVGIHLQPIGSVDIVGPDFVAYPMSHNLRSWSRQFQNLDLPGVSRMR
jgi:hypothetical protein